MSVVSIINHPAVVVMVIVWVDKCPIFKMLVQRDVMMLMVMPGLYAHPMANQFQICLRKKAQSNLRWRLPRKHVWYIIFTWPGSKHRRPTSTTCLAFVPCFSNVWFLNSKSMMHMDALEIPPRPRTIEAINCAACSCLLQAIHEFNGHL